MNVEILQSTVSDNFFYVIADDAGRAAVVDPVDAATAVAFVKQRGLDLQWVVNTHFHHDHVAGDDAVLDAFPDARLIAGPDASQIDVEHPFDRVLAGGDTFSIGEAEARVLDTPGHTPGHVSVLVGTHLFSGDTIFVGGAGNCRFGGDPGVLFRTFRDVLSGLGDEIRFYPGHDYSRRNIEFALSIEPEHGGAREMLERSERSESGIFLTTLGEERTYNPFFRFGDTELREALEIRHPRTLAAQREQSESDEEAVFRTVRELRNHW